MSWIAFSWGAQLYVFILSVNLHLELHSLKRLTCRLLFFVGIYILSYILLGNSPVGFYSLWESISSILLGKPPVGSYSLWEYLLNCIVLGNSYVGSYFLWESMSWIAFSWGTQVLVLTLCENLHIELYSFRESSAGILLSLNIYILNCIDLGNPAPDFHSLQESASWIAFSLGTQL